jgi:hypothetical protein
MLFLPGQGIGVVTTVTATIMPAPAYHRCLANEATMHGTQAILQMLPAEHSPALEDAIRDGVRQAVLHYALALDRQEHQLHSLAQVAAYVYKIACAAATQTTDPN